jgi:hypothetical protein
MDFWDIIWFILISFFFFAYLVILFQIFGDLFRRHDIGGFSKALWVIALIVFWWLAALIYLIANGKGMAERNAKQYQEMQAAQESYIKGVAGTGGAADQIARAKELLDSGAITQAEFDALKAKALAGN